MVVERTNALVYLITSSLEGSRSRVRIRLFPFFFEREKVGRERINSRLIRELINSAFGIEREVDVLGDLRGMLSYEACGVGFVYACAGQAKAYFRDMFAR